jgi:hypothetical protein
LLGVALLIGPPLPVVAAQNPYPECAARTATNASLIFTDTTEIVVNGSAQAGPLHVAIFTPAGDCAGSVRWSGTATALTAWGTANLTDTGASGALSPGDSMHVHLFVPETDTEYTSANSRITVSFRSDRPYLTVHQRYVPDGIYVINRMRIHSTLVSRKK